jgi:peptidoglycan/xylan/chitin deacetylase (PgdA/CDA1 family)
MVSLRAFRSCFYSGLRLGPGLASLAFFCGLAWAGPADAGQQPSTEAGLVIFGYQRVGEDEYPTTSVDFEQFVQHVQELRTGGYSVLSLPQAVDLLRRRNPLPPRAVVITLDGAFRSAYDKAVPRLRAAKFPFTMFVAPEVVGTPGRIGWGELREAAKAGATIGVQTAYYHMPLAQPAKNVEELARAVSRFRDEIGAGPAFFAYPYGSSSRAVRALVGERGFTAAFGQQGGVVHAGSDLLDLPRFMVSEEFGNLDRFRLAANALPFPAADLLPADTVLTTNPPNIGFTVPGATSLAKLSCSGAGQGRLPIQQLGTDRVEVRVTEPFDPGRARINCTLPTPDGRYRWLGFQFLVPSDVAVEEAD